MKEPCREFRITADMVGKLVNHLVPSLRGGDRFFAPAFLDAYRSFTTTKHVMDLLLKRYAYFCPDCKEDEQVKSILCSFLDTWIDKYPEEFCQTSDLSILKKLKAYLSVNMPYSDLKLRVHILLMELQQESNESERADEEDSDLGSHISGDSEIDLWVPSVKLQLEPDWAPVTESPQSTRMFCYWSQM
ncbi:ral guanine nucleotide dissociation stimulator-like [Arvicanthis niloticus]|uniref:ral guanine nucleotide dissociation stimulator-like n=1 Tax=Arvicanthis niloticus TaxID=61156 RepID=UPI00402B949B